MPAQSQWKSLPSSLAMRLFALQILPILILSGLVLPVAAQMQFVGNVNVLPMNGITLGGQNHMAVDPAGNVYISDPTAGQVLEVHVGGAVTQLIGPSTTINGLSLNNPSWLTVDNLGNVDISDTGNNRVVVVPPGGGTPTLLPVYLANTPGPAGIATDTLGDVYLSIPLFQDVFKVQPPPGNTTFINPQPSTLGTPQGLAVNIAGDVFIADSANAQVVELTGGTSNSINTGSAGLVAPTGVALDSGRNLYIADPAGAQVVEVPWQGTSYSVILAGVYNTGSVTLISPTDVGTDSNDDVYILDQGTTTPEVIKVEKSGVNFGNVSVGNGPGVTMTLNFTVGPSTVLGSILLTNSGGPADFTRQPTSTCAYTTNGNDSPTCTIVVTFQPQKVGLRQAVLTVNAFGGGQILRLPLSGTGTGPILAFTPGILTTVAGVWGEATQPSYARASGNSAFVELSQPTGVALDGAGNLYINDYGWGIRKLAPTGYFNMTTVIGGNTNYYAPFSNPANGDGGPAINATIFDEWGIALDAAGDIFTTDDGWQEVREDTVQNGMMKLVGGYWFPYYDRVNYSGDYGLAINADITYPWGVAVDAKNNVYVNTLNDGVVRKIAPNGIITPFAGHYGYMGNGGGYYGDGGPADLAGVNQPTGMTFDGQGNMFIADTDNNVIRKVTPEGIISTVAGSVNLPWPSLGYNVGGYSGDGGPATQALLKLPRSVAVDGGGNLYIADSGNSAIRMVSANGIISTVAVLGACNPPNSLQTCYTGPNPGAHLKVAPSAGNLSFVPDSIVADASGDLYFSDDEGIVVRKLDVSDPPSLTFATLPVGSDSTEQDVTIQNLGSEVLTISSMTISPNFSFGVDTTCNIGSPIVLAPGQSCVLGIAFTPTAYGSLSGAVVLTLGNSVVFETIPLSGSATSLSQAITFNPLPAQIAYAAGTSLTLSATGGGSGNPVTFTVLSGPATILGTALKVGATGTVTVAANQAGNAAYTAAPQVTQSMIVSTSVAPTVVTGAATSVATTSATLQATVNPNNATTAYYFSYGTSATSLTKTSAIFSGLTGTTAIPVSANIGSLTPNTAYYFRVTAKSLGGQTQGSVMTFTTP